MPLIDCLREAPVAPIIHSCILSLVMSLAPGVLEALSMLGTLYAQ